MKNLKNPKFEVAQPTIKFTCDWAVYPKGSESSMCYTTSKERAELIADALNKYKGWASILPKRSCNSHKSK